MLIHIVEMLEPPVPLTDHLAPRSAVTSTCTCHENEYVHEYDGRVRGARRGARRATEIASNGTLPRGASGQPSG